RALAPPSPPSWARPSRSPLAPSDQHPQPNSPLSITARPLFQGAADREGRVQRGAPGSGGRLPPHPLALRWTRPSRSLLAPGDHHAKLDSPLSITARPLFQGAVDREGRVQ